MDLGIALDMSRDALFMALSTATPILVIGLFVGLAISVVQSVTQLQEQTLTFVPKIAAMVIAASFFFPWIATRMIDYTQQMLGTLP